MLSRENAQQIGRNRNLWSLWHKCKKLTERNEIYKKKSQTKNITKQENRLECVTEKQAWRSDESDIH